MKVIQPSTKIAEVIAFDSRSIEAIASLSKPLSRLKNPILRKIMASRVTIFEAAKMGNIALEDFKKALEPIGLALELQAEVEGGEKQAQPNWLLTAAQETITLFDVREIIANGSDPLKEILGKFKTIKPGEILCVINKFIPTPLIHLLKQHKAKDAFVQTMAKDLYYTYFIKEGISVSPEKTLEKNSSNDTTSQNLTFHSRETFEALIGEYPLSKQKELDVRSLEMPGPMEAILMELNALPKTHLLYVHHKRIPIYLLEELSGQDYKVHVLQNAENDIKMVFTH